MGKVEFFQIVVPSKLENNYFESGEVIKGHVVLRLKDELKINFLELKLNGLAHIQWTETRHTHHNGQSHSHSHTESGNQTLFDAIIPIIPKILKSEQYINAGEHIYPFQFQLPPNLPGSLKEYSYHIRYKAHAHLDIPWAIDKHAEYEFYVKPNLDLNYMPMLRQPLFLTDTKTPGLFGSKSIMIKFEIDKGGYAPGQMIRFRADVDNQTDKELKDMSVRLVQQVRIVSSSGRSRHSCRDFGTLECPNSVQPGGNMRWEHQYLVQPTVFPTTSLRVLQLTYFMEFRLKAGFWSVTKTLPIPIYIGTVPLIEHEAAASNFAPRKLDDFVPGEYSGDYPIYPTNDLPPPYESAFKN